MRAAIASVTLLIATVSVSEALDLQVKRDEKTGTVAVMIAMSKTEYDIAKGKFGNRGSEKVVENQIPAERAVIVNFSFAAEADYQKFRREILDRKGGDSREWCATCAAAAGMPGDPFPVMKSRGPLAAALDAAPTCRGKTGDSSNTVKAGPCQ